MPDHSDKSFDQIDDDDDDFEFGSRDNVKSFDHLAIDWWLILEASTFYVVYASIAYVGCLLLFLYAEEYRGLVFAASSFACSIPGALFLSRRVKNRPVAHGIYYSVLPTSILIAQPQLMALGPEIATTLIIVAACLTTLVAMSPSQLLIQPLNSAGQPAITNIYQGLQVPDKTATAANTIGRKDTALSDVNNPYLELDVSDVLLSNNNRRKVEWTSILLSVVLYFPIAFACIFVSGYYGRTIFEALHHNEAIATAIFHCIRLLPLIAVSTVLGIRVRNNLFWNGILFVLLLNLVSAALTMAWRPQLDIPQVLFWILKDTVVVSLTFATTRLLARLVTSIRKAVWFER